MCLDYRVVDGLETLASREGAKGTASAVPLAGPQIAVQVHVSCELRERHASLVTVLIRASEDLCPKHPKDQLRTSRALSGHYLPRAGCRLSFLLPSLLRERFLP